VKDGFKVFDSDMHVLAGDPRGQLRPALRRPAGLSKIELVPSSG